MPTYIPPDLDDPSYKDSRRFGNPPPGGGGVGPGGGFGGSFGGGGSGFYGAGAPSGMGANALGATLQLPRRRMVNMGGRSFPVSYSPMVEDTVPAMLSPGEFVVNNRAAQMPGVMPALETLNAFGNGGTVMDYDMMSRALDGVLRMAYGGYVQPQSGGYGQQSFGQKSGAQPNSMFTAMRKRLGGGQPVPQPQGGGAETPVQSAGGNWTPTGWNPAGDPGLSFNPWSGSGSDRSRTLNQMYELLNQFGAGGWFSPEGSPQMMAALENRARGTAQAQQAQSVNQARLLGLDPGQAGSYAAESALRGQAGVSKAINDARLQQYLAQQQFGQGLLNTMGQFNIQDWLAERQGDIAKRYGS